MADGAEHLTDFGYDVADRLISAALNNGVASGYDYDDDDRLTGLTHVRPGPPPGGTLFDKSFAYDAAGNRLWSRDNLAGADNLSELYRYDGLHRLTRFERGELGPNNDQIVAPPSADHLASQTWPTPGGLDKRGNWLSHDWSVQRDPSPESHTETRTRNGVNEYLTRQRDAEPAVNLMHDAAGNLVYDGRFTYAFDAENRLATVHDGPVELLAVTYDALGRAVERTTQQGLIRYIYDAPSDGGPNGYAVLTEYDGAGTLLREFVHAAGHTQPLVLIDYTSAGSLPAGTAETFYYLHDERGSVTALTDDAGAVVESYRYDAYGGAYVYDGAGALVASWLDTWDDAALTPSAVGNPYGFTGHRFSVAGLYEAPFRAYSPSLGRWLQRDPLGYTGGVNVYEYVLSAPIRLLDPLGLRPLLMVFRDFAGIAIAALRSGGENLPIPPSCTDCHRPEILNPDGPLSPEDIQRIRRWDVPDHTFFDFIDSLGQNLLPFYGGARGLEDGINNDDFWQAASGAAELLLDLLPWTKAGRRGLRLAGDVLDDAWRLLKERAEALAKKLRRNRVTLPGIGELDLTGKGHFDKGSGKEVPTPHVHEERPPDVRPSDGKPFPGGTEDVPRPATPDDLDKAQELVDGGRECPDR